MRLSPRQPDDLWLEDVLLHLTRTKYLDEDIRDARDAILRHFAAETADATWLARVDENQQYLDMLAQYSADHRPSGLIASSTIKARLEDLQQLRKQSKEDKEKP